MIVSLSAIFIVSCKSSSQRIASLLRDGGFDHCLDLAEKWGLSEFEKQKQKKPKHAKADTRNK
jgi:hypothetical protein